MTVSQAQPAIDNEHGRIEITPADDVQALSWGTWTFRWISGFDVEPGGGMELILVPRFPTNRWSLPQLTDPTAPGYVTARSGEDIITTLDVLRWPLLQKPHGATLHIIQVGVGGRILEQGETIEVTYGDPRGGSLGAQVQASAREVSFPVFVASGQQPKFFERFVSWNRQTDVATLRARADFNPSLRVVGGPASSFHLVAPMEVNPDQPFTVRLSALDSTCNAATGYAGQVEITTTDPEAPPTSSVQIEDARSSISDVILHTPGFHRVYAIDPNRNILGVSNPIRVVARQPRSIYWGDTHGHSEQSDGNGTPDEHYTYARDVALLDFACVCDHDAQLYAHPDRWDAAADKVGEYSEPGRFIALLGYEGRLTNEAGEPFGDINVYYLADRDEMLPPFPIPLTRDIIGDKQVIVVPHTPLYGPECGMGTHWQYLVDIPPETMPLVEVFSTHGNSEYRDCPRHVIWQADNQSVLDALKQGFRLGMIGSSDYHEVLTGSLLRIQDTPRTINNRHMQARCGLAAVTADDLSRSSLFGAMKSRRTFATSGIRAYVDFSVNGHTMGAECSIASPAEPRRLAIAVAAPEPIVKLEVIRSGVTIADLADGSWHVEAEIEDRDPIPEGAFYYLRATTERTDFAWSSPVWVDITP